MSTALSPSRSKPYFGYWGKANSGLHLLPFHGLDVAAAAGAWLWSSPEFCRQLSTWTGVPKQSLLPWVLWAIGLHDLGKFSELFQVKAPWAFQQLRGIPPQVSGTGFHHEAAGEPAFWEWVQPLFPDPGWGNSALRSWAPLLRASFQHHGAPVAGQNAPGGLALTRAFTPLDRQALITFASDWKALLDLPPEPPPLGPEVDRASFWVAGLVVLADWIGSQASWFPPEPAAHDLTCYWSRAQALAERAVAESGVCPCEPAGLRSFVDLFPHLAAADPTPLQAQADSVPLGRGPSLFILESLTGDGKTEAALRLLHRMLAQKIADGFYFALPTMATANAMYDRLRETFPRLFREPSKASFILAHSARNLVGTFRQSILPESQVLPEPSPEDPSAEARCRSWLADRSKKALLAQGGVGTLDQALLAVLQAKHQDLRLLGLFRKVLVVDEVHAYDPYMQRTLKTLLQFHSTAGGSAILLSATLPLRVRQELVEAFAAGVPGLKAELHSEAYPLMTAADASGTREVPVQVAPERHRTVQVTRLEGEAEVSACLLAAARDGKCACWIRNSIAEAVAAYRRLQELGGDSVSVALFHARFALGDRLDREREVVDWFGKQSLAPGRSGKILIATQVVEQSLDLDFDVLVSDLAPIDLLLQRSGRLGRHPRDPQGNPLPPGSRDLRPEPCLHILAPDPFAKILAGWMEAVSRPTTKVYPDTAALWRSLKALLGPGRFELPGDARSLIESVYGADAEPAPDSLAPQESKALGQHQADQALAIQNTLDLAAGYQALGVTWLPDAVIPTRLGDPTRTFRLARWDGSRLIPWRHQDPDFPWELSEIRLRQAQVEAPWVEPGTPIATALAALNQTLPDLGLWTPVLPLQEQPEGGTWAGKIQDGQGKTREIRYSKNSGLEFTGQATFIKASPEGRGKP